MAPENPQIARVIQNKKKTEGNVIQELQVILQNYNNKNSMIFTQNRHGDQ